MKKVATVIALVVALGIGVVGSALAGLDFGLETQNLLNAKSQPLFGVGKPIDASSQDSIDAATAEADPTDLVTLANGLSEGRDGGGERRSEHRHDGALAERHEPHLADHV